MSKNLTLTGAGFNTTGKFGASLNAGYGELAASPLPVGPFSVTFWFFQATVPGGLKVAVGQPNAFYIGHDAAGKAYGAFGGSNERILSSTVQVCDGQWHYGEFGYDGTAAYLFVDGVLLNSQGGSLAQAGGSLTGVFGVREFAVSSGIYDWVGEIDDVAVWGACLHTSTYTRPTAPTDPTAANLIALWSLNSSGADSATGPAAASALTFNIAPTSGFVGAASTVFRISANGSLPAPVLVTPNDGSDGGTFTPSSAAISNGQTVDFTYTAATAGTKTVGLTNNGGLANPTAVSYVASPVSGNNALTNGTANIAFSPENWEMQASKARTINAGAEFRLLFTGTACTLQFDVSTAGAPLSQISYQVDGTGAWTTTSIAANVVVAMPASTSDYANKGGHLLHVVVKSTSETINRWAAASQTAVVLTGIMLDPGKSISKPAASPLRGIIFGDSITEGVRTVNATANNDTDRNDARQSWAYVMGKLLGADVGVIGFGRLGFTVTGNPDVPVFGSTWNYLSNGVPRTFATALDFVGIHMGTNDGAGNTIAAATAVLNGVLAATPAKIIVFRPFKDASQAANLQAAIAACSSPARCTYVDTAGWFNTANSADALHPYGNENITHIAPLAAAAVRTALAGSATLTQRTLRYQLEVAGANAINLTGLEASFYENGVRRYFSATETTDGTGFIDFTFNSTLAAGQFGQLSVLHPDGRHFFGNVAVS